MGTYFLLILLPVISFNIHCIISNWLHLLCFIIIVGAWELQQIKNKAYRCDLMVGKSTITGQKSGTSSSRSSSSTDPINRQFPLRTVQRKARSLFPQVKYAVLHKFASELMRLVVCLLSLLAGNERKSQKKVPPVNVFMFNWSIFKIYLQTMNASS